MSLIQIILTVFVVLFSPLQFDDAGSCLSPIQINPFGPFAVHVTRGTGVAWLSYQSLSGNTTAILVSPIGQNIIRFWDYCQGHILCTVDEGMSKVCNLRGDSFVIEERLLGGDVVLVMVG